MKSIAITRGTTNVFADLGFRTPPNARQKHAWHSPLMSY